MILLYLEVSKKKSDDKKKKKKRLQKSGRWKCETVDWREKVKEKKSEMEWKINKYFFSLLLYLLTCGWTFWVGWDRMLMGH